MKLSSSAYFVETVHREKISVTFPNWIICRCIFPLTPYFFYRLRYINETPS